LNVRVQEKIADGISGTGKYANILNDNDHNVDISKTGTILLCI